MFLIPDTFTVTFSKVLDALIVRAIVICSPDPKVVLLGIVEMIFIGEEGDCENLKEQPEVPTKTMIKRIDTNVLAFRALRLRLHTVRSMSCTRR